MTETIIQVKKHTILTQHMIQHIQNIIHRTTYTEQPYMNIINTTMPRHVVNVPIVHLNQEIIIEMSAHISNAKLIHSHSYLISIRYRQVHALLSVQGMLLWITLNGSRVC